MRRLSKASRSPTVFKTGRLEQASLSRCSTGREISDPVAQTHVAAAWRAQSRALARGPGGNRCRSLLEAPLALNHPVAARWGFTLDHALPGRGLSLNDRLRWGDRTVLAPAVGEDKLPEDT